MPNVRWNVALNGGWCWGPRWTVSFVYRREAERMNLEEKMQTVEDWFLALSWWLPLGTSPQRKMKKGGFRERFLPSWRIFDLRDVVTIEQTMAMYALEKNRKTRSGWQGKIHTRHPRPSPPLGDGIMKWWGWTKRRVRKLTWISTRREIIRLLGIQIRYHPPPRRFPRHRRPPWRPSPALDTRSPIVWPRPMPARCRFSICRSPRSARKWPDPWGVSRGSISRCSSLRFLVIVWCRRRRVAGSTLYSSRTRARSWRARWCPHWSFLFAVVPLSSVSPWVLVHPPPDRDRTFFVIISSDLVPFFRSDRGLDSAAVGHFSPAGHRPASPLKSSDMIRAALHVVIRRDIRPAQVKRRVQLPIAFLARAGADKREIGGLRDRQLGHDSRQSGRGGGAGVRVLRETMVGVPHVSSQMLR